MKGQQKPGWSRYLLVFALALSLASSSPAQGQGDGAGQGAGSSRRTRIFLRNAKGEVIGVQFILWADAADHHAKGGKGGGKKPPPEESPCDWDNDGKGYAQIKDANRNPVRWSGSLTQISVEIFTDFSQNDPAATQTAVEDSFIAWTVPGNLPKLDLKSGIGSWPGIKADGRHTVAFRQLIGGSWNNVLAATWLWWDTNGTLIDSDIVFNRGRWTWKIFGAERCEPYNEVKGKEFDIANVGTHEAGHFFGLDHPDTETAAEELTMWPSAGDGETRKGSLSQGDKDGISATYP